MHYKDISSSGGQKSTCISQEDFPAIVTGGWCHAVLPTPGTQCHALLPTLPELPGVSRISQSFFLDLPAPGSFQKLRGISIKCNKNIFELTYLNNMLDVH